MAVAATDQQVQRFVSERTRVRAEQIRALVLAMADDISAVDDIYAALNVPTPTWTDTRTDGPPHLLTPSDVLGIHAFVSDIRAAMVAHGQYPVILKACARPVSV
jgi:biotin carboxylase